jgi:hypothetical protein
MTLQELEVAIRDLFKQIYHKEYVAKLKLEELQTAEGTHRGYKLTLGMNNIDKPLIISFEGGEVAYLKFLRQEWLRRELRRIWAELLAINGVFLVKLAVMLLNTLKVDQAQQIALEK